MSTLDKYADVHQQDRLNGPGDQRPTALQIIQDNGLQGQMTNRVVFITGCSSGVGIPTAQALAATGAKVYGAVRNIEKGKSALKKLVESGQLELLELKLDSLDSVRHCAAEFQKRESKLNILINNAGIMAVPQLEFTEDGFESQLGTNHLGHFLLFQLLKPQLLVGSTPNFHSRIVAVSSTGHQIAAPNFDDINLKQSGAYEAWAAYGASKTAVVWTANEIERRYGSGNAEAMITNKAIHANSVMPGGIATGLQVNVPGLIDMITSNPQAVKNMKSAEQGAATSVWAAVDKAWEGKGGKWLEDCQIGKVADPRIPALQGGPGYAPWAYDEEGAERLWDLSLNLVGNARQRKARPICVD